MPQTMTARGAEELCDLSSLSCMDELPVHCKIRAVMVAALAACAPGASKAVRKCTP